MATTDHTVPALRALLERGEKLEQLDNEQMNALAHAVGNDDLAAATRLLKLGAAADARVGPAKVPVAMLLVYESNIDGIVAFKRAGVDFSKIRHDGLSAAEVARRRGDQQVLQTIGGTL